ncbi:MAG: hypothetical protein WC783_00160 [Candidatus Paceibacterota bacterium]|jgi:activator of 2-hydroxyglutaryl-CoA dehydratase
MNDIMKMFNPSIKNIRLQIEEISKKTKMTETAVINALIECGVYEQKIKDMILNGVSKEDIAKRIGTLPSVIDNYIKKMLPTQKQYEEKIEMELQSKIINLMVQRNITKEYLANKLKKDPKFIDDIIFGKKPITIKMLSSLCWAMNANFKVDIF